MFSCVEAAVPATPKRDAGYACYKPRETAESKVAITPMAHLHLTAASLRIVGDDLDPDEVSAVLCSQPTTGFRKGQVVRGLRSGRESIKRSGLWMLDAEDHTPGNLDQQVRLILDKLPPDLFIWESLSLRYTIEIYCGWFMEETDEEVAVSPNTFKRLGERGISLGISMYVPLSGEDDQPKE